MRVVVVGAGVIGAAIARGLARHGAEVIVLDAGAPAATPASFGWINASFYADEAHHQLRCAGIAAFHRLIAQGGNWPVTFGGALWWEAQGDELREMAETLTALGYPVRALLGEEIARQEPHLAKPPQEALFFESEGWADVPAFAARLLSDARAAGAKVLQGAMAEAVLAKSGVVSGVGTTLGDIAADHVVVAAGNGSPLVLESVGVRLPMLTRPGAIVTSAPVRARLNSVMVTPEGEVRQLPDGRLLSPSAANHQGDSAEAITEPLEQIGATTAARLGTLMGEPNLAWEDVQVAYRPVPQDGLPALGPAGPERLHVAVMHSGVTLAVIAAEITVARITGTLSNEQSALAAPYDAMRFT